MGVGGGAGAPRPAPIWPPPAQPKPADGKGRVLMFCSSSAGGGANTTIVAGGGCRGAFAARGVQARVRTPRGARADSRRAASASPLPFQLRRNVWSRAVCQGTSGRRWGPVRPCPSAAEGGLLFADGEPLPCPGPLASRLASRLARGRSVPAAELFGPLGLPRGRPANPDEEAARHSPPGHASPRSHPAAAPRRA